MPMCRYWVTSDITKDIVYRWTFGSYLSYELLLPLIIAL